MKRLRGQLLQEALDTQEKIGVAGSSRGAATLVSNVSIAAIP